MPVSPVTELTVMKGSSSRCLSEPITSATSFMVLLDEELSTGLSTTIRCGTLFNKEADFAITAGAVIEDDTSSADKLPIVFVR